MLPNDPVAALNHSHISCHRMPGRNAQHLPLCKEALENNAVALQPLLLQTRSAPSPQLLLLGRSFQSLIIILLTCTAVGKITSEKKYNEEACLAT